MGWREEFPTRLAQFDIPESIIRLEGIEDMSWKNDTCPSFGLEVVEGQLDLRIWCEAVDPDDRQSGFETRYMIQAYGYDTKGAELVEAAGLEFLVVDGLLPDGSDHVCWATDSPDVAIRVFIIALSHLQAAKAAGRNVA